jgi:hypothetical protein
MPAGGRELSLGTVFFPGTFTLPVLEPAALATEARNLDPGRQLSRGMRRTCAGRRADCIASEEGWKT